MLTQADSSLSQPSEGKRLDVPTGPAAERDSRKRIADAELTREPKQMKMSNFGNFAASKSPKDLTCCNCVQHKCKCNEGGPCSTCVKSRLRCVYRLCMGDDNCNRRQTCRFYHTGQKGEEMLGYTFDDDFVRNQYGGGERLRMLQNEVRFDTQDLRQETNSDMLTALPPRAEPAAPSARPASRAQPASSGQADEAQPRLSSWHP